MSRTAEKIIYGSIGLFVMLSVVAGGPSNAVGLLLVSIVCTMGIGLLIWIPSIYVTGTLIVWGLDFYRMIHKKKEKSPQSPEIQALSRYIQSSRASGTSDTEITRQLLEVGWLQKQVEAAFQEMKK